MLVTDNSETGWYTPFESCEKKMNFSVVDECMLAFVMDHLS